MSRTRLTPVCLPLFLLSLVTRALPLCFPEDPCINCNFLSIERDARDCQIYYYCFYGTLLTTRSCGYNQIYSIQIYACVPSTGTASTDSCHGIPDISGQPSTPTANIPPTQQSTLWKGDVHRRWEFNHFVSSTFTTTTTAQTSQIQHLSVKPKPEDKCGIKVSRYIVGGQRADRAEWAWQVSLQAYDVTRNRFKHVCGGTLIHKSWIVTAAHCVYSSKAKIHRFIVAAGQHRLHFQDPWRQIRDVDKAVIHFGYRHHGNYPNDIALLRLSTPFNLTTAVRPACLPIKSEFSESAVVHENNHGVDVSSARNNVKTKCWTTGWGRGQGKDREILREVNVRFIDPIRCRKRWPGYIKHFHICALSNDGTACRGDSGGPLVCVSNGRYFLQGVVSWGEGTCDVNNYMPTVYTRVADYINWIRYTIDRFTIKAHN